MEPCVLSMALFTQLESTNGIRAIHLSRFRIMPGGSTICPNTKVRKRSLPQITQLDASMQETNLD
uniref:Uncharacterized protein n=1 Tax=Romanomermis culicivorax TaxID=13658 RepID=A0A915LEH0_ROMCU